ncbi:MAG: zf-HC2 domain-containing protein [Candidatus Aminicenantes bacterium]|nr:zf-HC2 domain-containing protein [Candidatus Aminicenantes bacterium]
MKECPNEERIDRYLTGRLTESESAELEEHYFNCSTCFQKISERNELVEVIRDRGAEIFEGAAGSPVHSWKKAPWKDGRDGGIFPPDRWKETLSKGFLPRVSRWVTAAAAAALLLVAVLVLIPKFKITGPEFASTGDETVRGESLILVSPLGEVKAGPSALEWKPISAAVEYRVDLSGPETLWTSVTPATKADLPENMKGRMKPGLYQWQVKAYSAQGILLAVSPKVEFKIPD